jgi:hypothetical protein
VALSLLVSYESFGDVLVRLRFPSGRSYPGPSPSELKGVQLESLEDGSVVAVGSTRADEASSQGSAEGSGHVTGYVVWYHGHWHARLSGWHSDRTSVPELHAVATVPAPLPPSFNVTLVAPDPALLVEIDGNVRARIGHGEGGGDVGGGAAQGLKFLPQKPFPLKEAAKVIITGVVVTPVVEYLTAECDEHCL